MIIVDLALQGFRDLKASAQARFHAGYNGVVCTLCDPGTVVSGLVELLFAEGYDPAALRFAAAGVTSTRGAITVTGADKATFRVVRDLVKGGAQLSSYDSSTRAFTTVGSEVAEIGQFLRGRVGLPSRTTFVSAFVLTSADLPSRAAPAQVSSSAVTAPEPVVRQAWISAGERAGIESRLKEIDAALAARGQIEQLEYELDGMQKRRFRLDDRLKAITFDEGRLRELQREAARLAFADAIPDDFLPRYLAARGLAERREQDLAHLRAEREALEEQARSVRVEPLRSDKRLWVGLGAGVAVVAVGFALGGVYRYLAFLDIPAFGVAALALWQNLSARDAIGTARRRAANVERREARVAVRDEEEIAAVKALLAPTGLSSPAEIEGVLGDRQRVRASLAEAQQQKLEAERNPELGELTRERAALDAEMASLEQRLQSLASSGTDVAAMKLEAEELRARISETSAPTRPVAAPVPASAAAPGEPAVAKKLVDASEDLRLTDRYHAAAVLGEHTTALLAKLGGPRYGEVVVQPAGTVRAQVDGVERAFSELEPGDRELVYLALRGAALTGLDARMLAPLVIGEIDDALAPALALLATELGAAGVQVLRFVRKAEACGEGAQIVTFGAGA